jgi:Mn2+-dependent serine/threonine protein kinase
MLIEVKGNSGCAINIVGTDNKLLVHKSTYDKSYIPRLVNQANKQKNAALIANIEVPEVHAVITSDDSATIVMDYVHAKNFIDFIEQSPISAIDDFIKSITSYVDKEISNSEITEIDNEIFLSKIESIKSNAIKKSLTCMHPVINLIDDAYSIFEQRPNMKIPVGVCHGDLTLSNILFSSSKYYLIDFLDSFIETPIQDIVKLRQDTSLFWSLQMYDKPYDKIRIKTVFDYIDSAIDSYFSATCSSYKDSYTYIQLINILRIVPYAKSSSVVDYLEKTITSLLSELK